MRIHIKLKKVPLYIYIPNRLALKYLSHQDPKNKDLYSCIRKSLRYYRGWVLVEVDSPREGVYIRIKL